GKGRDVQILKVTVPENLNHENLLDGIFKEYTEMHELRQVETTNLGTMILYTYAIRSKNDTKDKDLLDKIGERNANLKVSLTYMESANYIIMHMIIKIVQALTKNVSKNNKMFHYEKPYEI